MDPAQNESKSTEPVLAIELASETPKAVSTPKILQDEAQSTPLAAIPEDDESSSHSVDPVAAVDRSAPPDDGGSLKGTIAEAGSASSVFKPPKAKDMDSVKRSLDLVDDSIEGLHVANDTTKETPTNLQTTHEKTSAKVIKRKNAVTDVPTSPDAETVKDSESQVNSKEPATGMRSMLILMKTQAADRKQHHHLPHPKFPFRTLSPKSILKRKFIGPKPPSCESTPIGSSTQSTIGQEVTIDQRPRNCSCRHGEKPELSIEDGRAG